MRKYIVAGLLVWLPLAVTMVMVPLLFGVRNWYQTPPFFVAMVPVVAGDQLRMTLAGIGSCSIRFD